MLPGLRLHSGFVGTRAKKTRSKSFQAFSSINHPELGVLRDGVLLRYIRQDCREAPVFYDRLDPRVALLNIGEEKEKGNQQTKATYELMDNSTDFNFVGNIEAKHLFDSSVADVIVCDGFVGNTILKMSEGIFEMTRQQGLKNTYFENLNYEKVGGTPVLGINSTVIIGHGCSSATAIENMVLQTEKTIKAGVAAKLREIFS